MKDNIFKSRLNQGNERESIHSDAFELIDTEGTETKEGWPGKKENKAKKKTVKKAVKKIVKAADKKKKEVAKKEKTPKENTKEQEASNAEMLLTLTEFATRLDNVECDDSEK